MAEGHDPLTDFDVRSITIDGVTHDVYVQGEGPAILVIPEVPGITPEVADCARRLTAAGFSTWMPSLFGDPGTPFSNGRAVTTIVKACVTRQFLAFARSKRAPKVDWLRELGRMAHEESGGPGIGVIGMCFTGNFALALAIDERVKVPVMSQPSLPFGITKSHRADLHVAPDDLATIKGRTEADDLCVLGFRFTGDPLVPAARFDSLRRELGDGFVGLEIDSSKGNEWGYAKDAHSVTSKEWSPDSDTPTGQAWDLLVEHFTTKLLG
ncbi:MAG: dienelactone hydrolase family protein [Actinomycetota bacterium]